MPTPEIPIDQQIIERPTEIISETLNQVGIISTPTNVTAVNNNNGKPLISTPVTGSAKIQLPSDQTNLIAQAKGSVSNAMTWLAAFLLRLIARKKYANTGN